MTSTRGLVRNHEHHRGHRPLRRCQRVLAPGHRGSERRRRPRHAGNSETAYQSVTWGYDEPDLLVLDRTRYADFKNSFLSLIRFGQGMQDEEALQVGFRNHFLFNNAITVPDFFAPASVAYFLNSKYIFPVFHEADYFNVDPFMKPTNQRVLVSTMYLTWQLSCISPRMNVKITGIASSIGRS
jgi:hypothetical protein